MIRFQFRKEADITIVCNTTVSHGSAMTNNRPLHVALISPKGPLYRHRGGIFSNRSATCRSR